MSNTTIPATLPQRLARSTGATVTQQACFYGLTIDQIREGHRRNAAACYRVAAMCDRKRRAIDGRTAAQWRADGDAHTAKSLEEVRL